MNTIIHEHKCDKIPIGYSVGALQEEGFVDIWFINNERNGSNISPITYCPFCAKYLTTNPRRNRKRKYEENVIGTRLYRAFIQMKTRCTNPGYRYFNNYGGRGITICDEWVNNFNNFREWALSNGYDDNLTLDRIDPNKHYTPDNCRWITQEEQNRNRRYHNWATINGVTKIISDWSRETGIHCNTIKQRIEYGHTDEEILYKGRLPGRQGRKKTVNKTRIS